MRKIEEEKEEGKKTNEWFGVWVEETRARGLWYNCYGEV